MEKEYLNCINVVVNTSYIEGQSVPEGNQYVFAYTITLHNAGQQAAQLKSRHWIITDANGETQEVKGEGVIGEKPLLQPGEEYQYTSGAVIKTPVGSMRGNYRLVAEDGTIFDAAIPVFTLSTPNILH